MSYEEEKNKYSHEATLKYFEGNTNTPVFNQIKKAILKKKIIICIGIVVSVIAWCIQRVSILNAVHDLLGWIL